MFTLSQASKDTKKLLKWFGLIIALLIVVLMSWKLLIYAKSLFFPTPPPKPTVLFGNLPQQNFPQNATDTKLSYSINTLSGQLPEAPGQAKVYKIQPVQPDLLALSKFNDIVTNAGFNSGYLGISDKVFEWKSNNNTSNLDRRLRYNVTDYSFNIVSSYTTNADILAAKNLPTEDKAMSTAQTLLENLQTLSTDIDLSKIKTNLFSIKNGSLYPATSLSNAQIIEVDFFQNDLDKLPIFYDNPNSSNIRVLVGGGGYQGQIVGAEYFLQKIGKDYSTYPIKTSLVAFNDLKQGNAYIASYKGLSSNVLITNVMLGYYISKSPQDFVMPVFVFEGNDNFFAYVPAITDELISK